MTTLNLGAIAIVWQGAYNGATTYNKNQAVSYNGNSYICKVNGTVGVLPTSSSNWDVMSQGSNVMTTVGDIIYQDAGGATRLAAGTPGQQLTVSATNKPSWANAGGYRGANAKDTSNGLVAASASYPWLNGDFVSLPNPACGPVRRSQARLLAFMHAAWLNEYNEVVFRGRDNTVRFAGTKGSVTPSMGSKMLTNISAENGLLRTGDYFIQLHCAGESMLALTAQGDVFACGLGSTGVLGLGDVNNRSAWTKIPYLGPDSTLNSLPCTIKALHVGQTTGETSHMIGVANTLAGKTVHAIDVNGRVFAWGMNNFGQLGIGNATAIISTPTPITPNAGFITADTGVSVKQISGSGKHTILVDSNGQGYACGDNLSGQLGIGTNTNTAANNSFVAIGALTNIYQVEAIQLLYFTTGWVDGFAFSLALKNDGTLLSVGEGGYGTLGIGGAGTDQTSYQTVTGAFSSLYITGTAERCTVAALGGTPAAPNGTIYTWGNNNKGQCGLGNTTDPQYSPVQPTVTAQNTLTSKFAVDGAINTTVLNYPRTGIAAILPVPNQLNGGGGGFLTVDANARLWYFGSGDGAFDIGNNATSTATSNANPQMLPSPWSVADGWAGINANAAIKDIAWFGDAQADTVAFVIQASDGRLFAFGSNTHNRFSDDALASGMFRQVSV